MGSSSEMSVVSRYATRGEASIAYQIFGSGPRDLVFSPGNVPIDLLWDEPTLARFLRRLSSFSRVIVYDKLGTGASDALDLRSLPLIQEWQDDLSSVLDAVGSERAVLVTDGTGGDVGALLFAATHPERTLGLVLANAVVSFARRDEFPWGLPKDLFEEFLGRQRSQWGTGANLSYVCPSRSNDTALIEWLARAERLTAPPRTILALWRLLYESDIRPVLPAIRVPTLVLHSRDNRQVLLGQGRYLAEHIHGAKLIELPSGDHHLHLGAPDAFADEIEAFLTGDPPKPGGERILATILFTDMVESTRLLVASGDRRWRDVLDAHDGLIDTELARYGGHRVQGTGDGVLATFDGPARAISCASDLNRGLQRLGLDIRTGIHVGEVERRGDDIAGIAVVIAARVNALAGAGEILVSRTVKDLVAGSGIRFAPKGAHTLKGIDEKWDLYAVERTP